MGACSQTFTWYYDWRQIFCCCKNIDENGNLLTNKEQMVVSGYNKQDIIDFDETYAHVARLEFTRM